MPASSYPIHEHGALRAVDVGATSQPAVVLLHGMLGGVDNWENAIAALVQGGYRVVAPLLPVYDLPLKQTSVTGLVAYVREVFDWLGLEHAVLAGNSLGGQVALLFTLRHPEAVSALVLTGSSGLYEVEMGVSTPRRQDREFIRSRAAFTFYDPAHATPELVDEVYEVVNDTNRALRLIKMARSTKAETLVDALHGVEVPVLLVWGRQDQITPPDVAEQFLAQLPDARLHLIDHCGHAPMLEHPDAFNALMLSFLAEVHPAPLSFSSHGRAG